MKWPSSPMCCPSASNALDAQYTRELAKHPPWRIHVRDSAPARVAHSEKLWLTNCEAVILVPGL
ncbi:hypothetical protein E2C01_082269 [Portunus trituberculatus]|uniref:Uncharacterized protein n=1 Tax=Portunus trituberculatus TaxID=210409 RepID=A0A5B7J3C1_PORTR|nr:hypothetical protein [Portunus trituberculatus]